MGGTEGYSDRSNTGIRESTEKKIQPGLDRACKRPVGRLPLPFLLIFISHGHMVTWHICVCQCQTAALIFFPLSLSLRESLGCYEPSDDSTFHRSADGPPVIRLLKDFPSRRDRRLFPAVEGLTTDRRGRMKCKSDTFTSQESQPLPPPTPTPT